MAEMAKLVDGLNAGLGKAIDEACATGRKLRGHGVAAGRKLSDLYQTMRKLLPQIRHWLRTGHVATGKIINLHIPELYSIVRGKVGKAVEFGLSWGLTRLRGGFILATLARERGEARRELRRTCGRRSRRSLRQSAARVRLRSRRPQRGERRQPPQARRSRCGTGPPGPHGLGGQGPDQGGTHSGAHAGRGIDRHHQGTEIRLQSSGCPLGRDDGRVRSARRLGVQPHEAGPWGRRKTEVDAGRMSEARGTRPWRGRHAQISGGGTPRAGRAITAPNFPTSRS
jgi:hypothetical protein